MPFVALLLPIWAFFGCAVGVMMVYGVFQHVAFSDQAMAAILAIRFARNHADPRRRVIRGRVPR
jgi:hypothetical protein